VVDLVLRQARQHDTIPAGATLVRDLELVTALGTYRPFWQTLERAKDGPRAGVGDDLEAVTDRRFKAQD
jgi:hypothetical protein